MKKPKYTRAQKEENAKMVQRNFHRIDPLIRNVKKNTPIHWTLFFNNGRRLELYPTTLSLHNPGKWLRRLTVDGIVEVISHHAELPPVKSKREMRSSTDDDFDVLEDFN